MTAVTIGIPYVQSNRRISRVVKVNQIRRIVEVESSQSRRRVTSVTIEIPYVQSNRRIRRVVEVHRISRVVEVESPQSSHRVTCCTPADLSHY